MCARWSSAAPPRGYTEVSGEFRCHCLGSNGSVTIRTNDSTLVRRATAWLYSDHLAPGMTLLAYLGGARGGFLGWTPAVMGVIVRVAAGVFPCSCSRPQNRVIMSMQPHPWPEVPAGTAKIARRAFRKGSLAMRARDELGAWYQDEAFRATYGTRGAPGISPAQLAMVTVLQFTGNLTDRQAADAVRGRLDWKYCLGLELDDEGFDFSVLSEFRSRLVEGGMETALLEALLARLGELGLVGAGMRQRTDSTHVLGRIRDLNRLELAGETVRAALEALAAAAPGWLAGVIDASWQEALRAADRCLPAAGQQGQARGPGRAVRPGRLPPAAAGPRPGRAGLAGRPARGPGAAPDLDPAVLPGRRRGRGEGDLAGGRAGPPVGQIPPGLAV